MRAKNNIQKSLQRIFSWVVCLVMAFAPLFQASPVQANAEAWRSPVSALPATYDRPSSIMYEQPSLSASPAAIPEASTADLSNAENMLLAGLTIIENNNFEGNTAYGLNSSSSVIAINNWWNDADGPKVASNPLGKGDAVTTLVTYSPFLLSPADTGLPSSVQMPSGTTVIDLNNYEGNTQYGFYSAQAVAVEHNWWGSGSGPYNVVKNPAGLGDRVPDSVTFNPWLSSFVVPMEELNPYSLHFGATIQTLEVSIQPDTPNEVWSLSENTSWLWLNKTFGAGPASVLVSVDRSSLANGKYNAAINVQIGGTSGKLIATVQVTDKLNVGDLGLVVISPAVNENVRTGDGLLVRAVVTNNAVQLPGATVRVRIPIGTYGALEGKLYDDGQHSDGLSQDGEYAAMLPLPDRITMPPGPYSVNVNASIQGITVNKSVSVNVVEGYGSAPQVAVTALAPDPTKYLRGDTIDITASVTFPDLGTYPTSSVYATLKKPDNTSTQIGLASQGGNTWKAAYTLLQAGHYELSVRVNPPASTGFVDGSGWAKWDASYETGFLALPAALNSPYPLRGYVPLEVCVSYQALGLDSAIVGAEVTSPTGKVKKFGPLEPVGSGCYAEKFLAQESGDHSITFRVDAYPFDLSTVVQPFTVSTQRTQIVGAINNFSESTVQMMDSTMNEVVEAADAAEYFLDKYSDQTNKIVSDAVVGILFVGMSGFTDLLPIDRIASLTPGLAWLNIAGDPVFKGVFFGTAEEFARPIGENVFAHYRQSPIIYYASEGDVDQILQKFDDDAVREFLSTALSENTLEKDTFNDKFVLVLQPLVADQKAYIQAVAANLVTSPPGLSIAEEDLYIDDLDLREGANKWLASEGLAYRSSFLEQAKTRKEIFGPLEDLSEFTAWTLLNVGASAMCDGPCTFLMGTLKVYSDYNQNVKKLDEYGRMTLLGVEMMGGGYWSERFLLSNTVSGLNVIAQTAAPNTPAGSIESIEFHTGNKVIPMSSWLVDNISTAHSDIIIKNTGTVTANFFPVLYGQQGQSLLEWWDNDFVADDLCDPTDCSKRFASVSLAPGEQKTVRLILLDEFTENEPRGPFFGFGGSDTYVRLFARTEQGSYLVDTEQKKYVPISDYQPNPSATRSKVEVQYLSDQGNQPELLEGETAWEFRLPLRVSTTNQPGTLTYQTIASVENPFPDPVTYVVTHQINPLVEITDPGEGVVSDDIIRWMKVLQPSETLQLSYAFRPLPAAYGSEVLLNPVTLSVYDAASDALTTITSSSQTVTFHPPLYAESSQVLSSQPEQQKTITIEVTNADTQNAQTGSLNVTLWDEQGLQAGAVTQEITVGASLTEVQSIPFVAPANPGRYILKADLVQGVFVETITEEILYVWDAHFETAEHYWLGDTVAFTNTSFLPFGPSTTVQYEWSFGDGATSIETSPSHTYSLPGTYAVTLSTTTPLGSDTFDKVLNIYSAPQSAFSATGSTLPGEVITFTNTTTTTPSGDPTVTYLWDFGDGQTSTEKDPTHAYSLEGTYTITLTASNKAGFTSYSQQIEILVPSTFSISGQILDELGAPVEGAQVSAGENLSAMTGSDGSYILSGLKPANYTITPQKSGYTFDPPSQSVTVSNKNLTGINFTAHQTRYSISGQVLDGSIPVAGVTITTSTGVTSITGTDGHYLLENLLPGTFTVTPSRLGWEFTPVSTQVTISSENITSINFAATQLRYSISGTVLLNGAPLEGVTVSTASGETAQTALDGRYTISDLLPGTYTLTPAKPGIRFTPSTKVVEVNYASQENIDFAADYITYTVRGAVVDEDGLPLAGVVITTGTGANDTTDADGLYAISGLLPGGYTLTPGKSGYAFSPPSGEITIVGADIDGLNFTGHLLVYAISGTVYDELAGPLAGVTVSTGNGRQAISSSDGTYSIPQLIPGDYTITPSLPGWTFAPTSRLVTITNSDLTANNFIGTQNRYVISGKVVDALGSPLKNVSISAGPDLETTSGEDGSYIFAGLLPGSYTVVPSLAGYSFSPVSHTITVVDSNISEINFTATLLTYSIQGAVSDNAGEPLEGVIVSTDTGIEATSGADGIYQMSGLLPGTYTITPVKAGYGFIPASRTLTIADANRVGQNFIGTQQRYTISGTVLEEGIPLSGVTISTSTGQSVQTGIDGSYTIINLLPGSYTLTPAKSGYRFVPTSQLVVLTTASQEQVDFTGELITYTIQGTILDSDGKPIAGATVSSGTGISGTTNAGGEYIINDLTPGTYTLTPIKPGFAFTPPSRTETIANASLSNIDFTGAALNYSVSGTIKDALENPVAGVTVSAGGDYQSVTAADGSYTILGLLPGDYTLTPSKSGFTFLPASRSVTVTNSNIDSQDFIAAPHVFSISGRVTGSDTLGIPGVLVTAGGKYTLTDTDGYYRIDGLLPGTYNVIPSKKQYTFNPVSRSVTITDHDVTAQNFTGGFNVYLPFIKK